MSGAAVIVGALLKAGALSCGGAQAADIVPHHAVYSMSLGASMAMPGHRRRRTMPINGARSATAGPLSSAIA